MPPLRTAFRQALAADASLSALLPGGVLDAETLPQDGGGVSSVPRGADGMTVRPFAVVRWRESDLMRPDQIGAETETVEVYVYQDIGYATIEAALSRIKTLAHRIYWQADDRAIAYSLCTHTSGEVPAEEYGGIPCRFIRFVFTHIRA